MSHTPFGQPTNQPTQPYPYQPYEQGQPPVPPQYAPEPAPKKSHKLRNGIIGGISLLVLIGGCSAAMSDGDDTTATTTVPAGQAAEEKAPKAEKAPKKEKAEKEEAPAAEATTKVSAKKLIADFEDNELKADKAYKGKTLEVTGVVEEVDTDIMDEDVYILRVAGGGDFELLTVDFYDIPTDVLADIDTGDKVTVIGEFKDGGDLGVEIEKAHVA